MSPRRWLALVTAFVAPVVARGQTVRGTIVDAADHPVPGVVVLLMDTTEHIAGRALSGQLGEFRVATTRAGTYRVRTMRIGYRPVLSDPISLVAGGEVSQRIVVSSVAVGLDTMRVVDKNECRAFTDAGAATFAVWDQIRTALTAAQLTSASRTINATTVAYERALDPRASRERVLRQQASISTGYVTREWRTLPPDSLHRVGYITTDRDGSVNYYAPGLDMLLSPVFEADHCFRLISDKARPGTIGIGFEPIPARKRGVPEIRGTLWVDRASSQLQRLEFRYVNATSDQENLAGGDVDFVVMHDGSWAIADWSIRMPVTEDVVRPGHGAETQLTELRVAGGRLALARRGNDTLWAQPPGSLLGSIADSASGAPIAGGRVAVIEAALQGTTDARGKFRVDGLRPGDYTLEIHTPALDSLNASQRMTVTFVDSTTAVDLKLPSARQIAATICGRASEGGMLVGSLVVRRDSSTIAAKNGRVTVEWVADPKDSTRVRRMEAPATADGGFRVCGIPTNTAVALRAFATGAETAESKVVRIPAGSRLARVELSLEPELQLVLRGATFTGVVVNDSTHEPIGGADVSFPDLGKSTITDAAGAFRLVGIPAGEQHLTVRRIGFGAADARLTFTGHQTVERRIVLGRAVTLDAVKVSERASDRYMSDFEENRRVGLGHFMTRDEISKFDGMHLSTALQQLPGIGLLNGRGAAWVFSQRKPPPLCPTMPPSKECLESHGYYSPDTADLKAGITAACYAQVYVDGVLMNGTREPTEPWDINQIPPDQVEAIEYYASAAQTPMRYSRMASSCGVVVIWTRRDPV